MNPIFKGCLSAAAVGAGSILFAQSPDTARFDENPQPGLWIYISSANGGTQMKVSDADIREIAWSEGSNTFLALASDNRLYEILPTGQIRVLAENQPQIPMVSPTGLFWAMADSEGVWAGKYGQPMSQIFSGQISPNQILFCRPTTRCTSWMRPAACTPRGSRIGRPFSWRRICSPRVRSWRWRM